MGAGCVTRLPRHVHEDLGKVRVLELEPHDCDGRLLVPVARLVKEDGLGRRDDAVVVVGCDQTDGEIETVFESDSARFFSFSFSFSKCKIRIRIRMRR